MKVIAGALEECVHVAGTANFLRMAEENGWETVYLGPAVPVEKFVEEIKRHDPEMVAVSYRLTPENAESAVLRLKRAVEAEGLGGRRFLFGGPPPVVDRLRRLEFFEELFSGEEPLDRVAATLKTGGAEATGEQVFPESFVERVHWKAPFPLLRHHFGLPDMDDTERGIEEIAEAEVLDVISLGTDQDAQENFYHPERQDPSRAGAGGVPVRAPEHFERLYQASRRGNFPLMRTYSGTDDHLRLAQMYVDTIDNAWCATSLFWFNRLDGRGPLSIEDSIRAHQELMRWHGERNIPVEANEPHHWGMRDAPDVVYVVASFLSAYNAKACGVKDYIAQYMFDSPPGLSDSMDLAKMLACIELNEALQSDDFRVYRQTRTGLLSLPADHAMALGQVGASVYLQMALRPHVVHIVSACEADHAATPADIILNTRLAQWVMKTALQGAPDMTLDPAVQERKRQLVREAGLALEAVRQLAAPGVADPWADPATLARAVRVGVLDAPHLKGNPEALGMVQTMVRNGASVAIDGDTRRTLAEQERLERALSGSARPV